MPEQGHATPPDKEQVEFIESQSRGDVQKYLMPLQQKMGLPFARKTSAVWLKHSSDISKHKRPCSNTFPNNENRMSIFDEFRGIGNVLKHCLKGLVYLNLS